MCKIPSPESMFLFSSHLSDPVVLLYQICDVHPPDIGYVVYLCDLLCVFGRYLDLLPCPCVEACLCDEKHGIEVDQRGGRHDERRCVIER